MNDNLNSKPPRLADQLFLWYCQRASIEDLHGDAEELFHLDAKRYSPLRAKWRYWLRIVSLMFSYTLKIRKRNAAFHHFAYNYVNTAMLRNYFRTGSRNFAKNKFFTVLNVIALALGMSLSIMFIAFMAFVHSYDDFHTNKDRIYRVTTRLHDNIENPKFASAPAGIAYKLREDFTGVEKVVRINYSLFGEGLYGERKVDIEGYFVDPEFFDVFNFPAISGKQHSMLSSPNTMAITESEAIRIFNKKDPVGEVIHMEPYGDFTVTGILRDVPKNSHMNFGMLASYSTLESGKISSLLESDSAWNNFRNSYVYLLLPHRSKATDIDAALRKIAAEQNAKRDVKASFELQSLDDIVPGRKLNNEISYGWDYITLIIFGSMTLMVLIPACSNYIHLAISQSLNRMKEIGVRKVMGGQKRQIFLQFVTETTMMMFMALTLSYLLFEFIRVDFLEMTEAADRVDLTPDWKAFAGFIGFALFLGFAAGAIPAMYFSKIGPIHALKGKLAKIRNNRFTLRKVMITAQFILSLGFIMAVFIVMQQYRHSVNYDFGFNQENILDVRLQSANPQIFKNEYSKLPFVHQISLSSDIIASGYALTTYFKLVPGATDSIEASCASVDEHFISNLGLQLLSGRNFNDNALANSRSIIVNEEFVKMMNITDGSSPLDKTVVLADGREMKITGVVKNFHYASLQTRIKSHFLEYDPSRFKFANVKIQSADIVGDITAMEEKWKMIGGEEKFTAKFFKDELDDVYSFYFVLIKFWSFLGFLAITVSCLGLLGTVVFTIRNRVKEVSIRKVMGASSESVVYLLSKDFLLLLVIASVITIPCVYFLLDYMLATVQYYSIEIGFIEIFGSVMIMIVICLTTILSQTLKAANTNPAENLRME